MNKNRQNLLIKLNLVSLLSEALSDSGLNGLIAAHSSQNDGERALGAAAFYRELTESGESSAADYLKTRLLTCETPFSRAAATGSAEHMYGRVNAELKALKEFIEYDCNEIAESLPEDTRKLFPQWKSGVFSLTAKALADEYARGGYGAVRLSPALLFDKNTLRFVPVKNLNPLRLSGLKEYEEEKAAAVKNTKLFLEGKPANNVLFYGDRGTGKSSTVHALLNEFSGRGLRLLQIDKQSITLFPIIKEQIARFPKLRFIIFLDDLSFEEQDSEYAALKAALEGSLGAAANALIYVTTNRRHLIKESRASRDGSEVHAADSIEEQLSLFDRFGLVITYIAPDKREYLSILRQILADRNISMPDDELSALAERYALRKGGRTPRAAKQLADMIEGGITF